MIYKRRQGDIIKSGFNYFYNKDGKGPTLLMLFIKIPLPVFIYKIYNDYSIDDHYKCWQYYSIFIRFRIRNLKYFAHDGLEPNKDIDKFIFGVKIAALPVRKKKYINRFLGKTDENWIRRMVPFAPWEIPPTA